MELLTGLRQLEGEFVGETKGTRSRTLLVSVAELAHRGLPTPGKTKKVLSTDLRKWRPADFAEYAFAVRRPVTDDCEHEAWSFFDGEHRYVIPALALLRAFVRPDTGFFPKLFKAQSLEDICSFGRQCEQSFVNVDGPGTTMRHRRKKSFVSCLSWFYCFPSARQAWASVYRYATHGRLAMDLPEALITATFTFVSGPETNNRYVTSVNLHILHAREKPLEFAQKHVRVIEIANHKKRPKAGAAVNRPAAVRQQWPEPISVPDDVWEIVEPLLRGRAGKRANLRPALNCVLQFVCSDLTWDEVGMVQGLPSKTGSTRYSRWRSDGRWAKVEPAVRQLMPELWGNK